MENDDNMCLPRAIGIALARCKHMENPSNVVLKRHYDSIRKKDRLRIHKYNTISLQKQVAVQLQGKANIPHNKEGVLTDIPLYEKSLGVGITVVSARSGIKKVHNSDKSYSTQIVLYHVEIDEGQGHFAVLTKMNALLGRTYYCDECDIGYNNNTQHKCKISWDLIGRNRCLSSGKIVLCDRCHAQCHSQECLAKHKLEQSGKYPSK